MCAKCNEATHKTENCLSTTSQCSNCLSNDGHNGLERNKCQFFKDMKKIATRHECERLRKFAPRVFTPSNTVRDEQFSRKAGVETEINSLSKQLEVLLCNSHSNQKETTSSIAKMNDT